MRIGKDKKKRSNYLLTFVEVDFPFYSQVTHTEGKLYNESPHFFPCGRVYGGTFRAKICHI